MPVDTAPRTRRSVLSLFAVAASGAAAASVAGVRRVFAAGSDGTPIAVGGSYEDVRTATRFVNDTDDDRVLDVINNQAGTAVDAFSYGGDAIRADSWTGTGLFAKSVSGATAIRAVTAKDTGLTFTILGETKSPAGVALLGNNSATVGNAQGIQGTTDSPRGFAATGWARAKGAGVAGVSGASFPTVPAGTGVFGHAAAGRGGVFAGGKAQARLVPSSAATHPTKGQIGDLFVDRSGRLWFCKGGSTWKQIA